MAPHSSTLTWKIPWMEEPSGLQSMGSLRVGHDWATSLSLFTFMHWRRKWQPTPVFLPGESQGRRSLVGCSLWGRTESDMTEVTYLTFYLELMTKLKEKNHSWNSLNFFNNFMFQVSIYACPSLEGGPATSAEVAGILRTDVAMQCSTAAHQRTVTVMSKKWWFPNTVAGVGQCHKQKHI